MPTTLIDGIATRYEVVGSGPPLLMYAPGGFNAVVEAWSTLGVYQKIKLLDHLPAHFTCILFDRRECGQSGGRIEPITWSHYVAQGNVTIRILAGCRVVGRITDAGVGGDRDDLLNRGAATGAQPMQPPVKCAREMCKCSSRPLPCAT